MLKDKNISLVSATGSTKMGKIVAETVGKRLGKDKGNSKYLYELFPYGPGKQACKFAGLPKPTGCV